MKKILLALVVALGVSLACSPKLSYFATETIHPQEVVDSLLGYRSEFQNWPSFTVIGVRHWDSTLIRTYILYQDSPDTKTYRNISVIEYGITDTVTVRAKEGRR